MVVRWSGAVGCRVFGRNRAKESVKVDDSRAVVDLDDV